MRSGTNRLEKVELTFRTPISVNHNIFDNEFLNSMSIAQIIQGSRAELKLDVNDSSFQKIEKNIRLPNRSGIKFARYTWQSVSQNGTDSLANFNYRAGSTLILIQAPADVSFSASVSKSLVQVDFTGTNIAKTDINPSFIIRQGADTVPLSLSNFQATASKAFLRTSGNINNVSYPFRQSTNVSLGIAFFVVVTETTETGEVQTVDNLADRRAYVYSAVFKWVDARGFEHRSTQALQKDLLTSQDISEENPIGFTVKCLNLTSKNGVRIDIYRTMKNTTVLRKVAEIINRQEDPFISYVDTVEDDDLGEVLLSDNFHPDGCDSIEVFNDRFYLSGFQNFRNKIQYSDLLNFGGSFAVRFTESNSILAEEDVIALRKMDNRLTIFTTRAIYQYPASNPQTLAPDLIEGSVNVSSINKNTITRSPDGLLFQSELGFYLLSRGGQFGFVGDPVKDISREVTVIASSINKANQEVLFFTDKTSVIVYNYFYKKWSTFSDGPGSNALHSLVHDKKVYILDRRGSIWIEEEPDRVEHGRLYTGVMETGWIQLSSILNYQKIKSFFLLGKFKNLTELCVHVYYDYTDFIQQVIPVNFNQISNPIPDRPFGSSQKQYGGVNNNFSFGQSSTDDIRQFRFMLQKQKCNSIKLKFCITAEKAVLSALRFQVRVLPGSGRVSPSKQFSQRGA